MIHSLPNTYQVGAPWALTSRWLDWHRRFATAALHGVLRLCRFRGGLPELRMSPEWLEEYERCSGRHRDDV
jgi:hypothetical protein